ncbi:MAG: hypothetical protein ACJ8J0_00250, partial [Longimicrobiaceae bacterium]
MCIPPRVRPVLLFAALALLAAACSRDVLDPAAARVAEDAPRAAATAGRPAFVRNAVKYRERGAKPATGRSGTSTLAARALLGKDGVTELEVTTGAFDPPSAPRPLTRVQVKQLDSGGRLLRTLNYANPGGGGTASFRYPGLPRGAALQVQGHVTEGKRTDVVTVTGTIQRRPDLRVRLEAPQQARPGFPVNLVATVSEGNGDVGARADCVLYVGGAEADRARGIWVDAGDAVACSFTHVFASVGAAQVRVEAANVSPGDFDPSNNAAEATVQVSGGSDFNYSADALDYVERSLQTDSNRVIYDNGQVSDQSDSIYQTVAYQGAVLRGWMPHGVTLATTSVRVAQSTNGVTVHAAAWPEVSGNEYPPVADLPGCGSRWSEGAIFYLCTTGTADEGITDFTYARGGGQVTYYGIQHVRFWWPDAPENVYGYDTEWSGGYTYDGPQITMGDDVSMWAEVTDAGRT